MYGLRDTPEPIEKIRKAQWTVENTRATQASVDGLNHLREAMRLLGLKGSALDAVTNAMKRFKVLDPKVRLPWE